MYATVSAVLPIEGPARTAGCLSGHWRRAAANAPPEGLALRHQVSRAPGKPAAPAPAFRHAPPPLGARVGTLSPRNVPTQAPVMSPRNVPTEALMSKALRMLKSRHRRNSRVIWRSESFSGCTHDSFTSTFVPNIDVLNISSATCHLTSMLKTEKFDNVHLAFPSVILREWWLIFQQKYLKHQRRRR